MKEKLLSVLVCPKCYTSLDYNEKEQILICSHDQLVYSILDGIPVLLEDKASIIKSSIMESNEVTR